MPFFRIYQYVVPLVLFPLCYWLWWERYDRDHALTLYALSIPIVFSYIVPALGTNWLRIWEFNTRYRLGRFRPQHGFLFGTATSLFGLVCLSYPPPALTAWELLREGIIMGSVVAFWNWLYDVHALRVGFLRVYNRAYAQQRGPEAIATEYCPVFFGSFGFCYAIAIRIGEHLLSDPVRTEWSWLALAGCHLLVILGPVLAFIAVSLITTGQTGLQTYEKSGQPRDPAEPAAAAALADAVATGSAEP